MRYGDSFIDRIADRLNLSKEVWIHIGIACGIAVLIGSLIVLGITPRNSEVAGLHDEIDGVATAIGGLTTDVDAIQAAIDGMAGLPNDVAGHANWLADLDSRVDDTEYRITTVAADLEDITCSPPETRLTGTFGDYTLYVNSSEPGNFTVILHMAYEPPLAAGGVNATYNEAMAGFYMGMVTSLDRYYIPALVYSGGDNRWLVTEVSFNVGVFDMEADTSTTVDITFTGLTITQAPDFAYVEVHEIGR